MSAPRGVVGRYRLGQFTIAVRLQGSWRGGNFYLPAVPPEMAIGCREMDWPATIGVVTHEALEFALATLQARCIPSPDYARASDGFLFHFDHRILSEAAAQVGEFLAACLPDLSTAYKRIAREAKAA